MKIVTIRDISILIYSIWIRMVQRKNKSWDRPDVRQTRCAMSRCEFAIGSGSYIFPCLKLNASLASTWEQSTIILSRRPKTYVCRLQKSDAVNLYGTYYMFILATHFNFPSCRRGSCVDFRRWASTIWDHWGWLGRGRSWGVCWDVFLNNLAFKYKGWARNGGMDTDIDSQKIQHVSPSVCKNSPHPRLALWAT